ncbi:MAG: hypothetical protein ACI9JD_005186 [Rhodococcus sp. (in: high G+C Gram-positive bacteria)]|jgi:hypothetical protein
MVGIPTQWSENAARTFVEFCVRHRSPFGPPITQIMSDGLREMLHSNGLRCHGDLDRYQVESRSHR